MWRIVVVVSMLLCNEFVSVAVSQEDNVELRQRFLRGISKAEHDFETLTVRANFEQMGRWKSLSPKSAALRKSAGLGSNEGDVTLTDVAMCDGFLLESGKDPKSGNDFVRAKNDSYTFSIVKSKNTGIASLEFLERVGLDKSVDKLIAERATFPRVQLSGAYNLWRESLFEIINYKSFVVERVYRVENEGNECIRVEFGYEFGDPSSVNGHRITNAFLVSDPQRNWALTKYGGTMYTYVNKSTLRTEATLEYLDNLSGFPIPSKITQRTTWPDNKGTELESELTSKNVTKNVSKDEFFLSYYGLPEPKFESRWYGNWIWILVVGIGVIGFGVFLRKRRAK